VPASDAYSPTSLCELAASGANRGATFGEAGIRLASAATLLSHAEHPSVYTPVELADQAIVLLDQAKRILIGGHEVLPPAQPRVGAA
jgi:hypothetical protein